MNLYGKITGHICICPDDDTIEHHDSHGAYFPSLSNLDSDGLLKQGSSINYSTPCSSAIIIIASVSTLDGENQAFTGTIEFDGAFRALGYSAYVWYDTDMSCQIESSLHGRLTYGDYVAMSELHHVAMIWQKNKPLAKQIVAKLDDFETLQLARLTYLKGHSARWPELGDSDLDICLQILEVRQLAERLIAVQCLLADKKLEDKKLLVKANKIKRAYKGTKLYSQWTKAGIDVPALLTNKSVMAQLGLSHYAK